MATLLPVRARVCLRGAVQGVGFRPFVYRLAQALGLSGWVENTPEGVRIEVEGPVEVVEAFARRVRSEAPGSAIIRFVDRALIAPSGLPGFTIRPSAGTGRVSTAILPDLATCEACRREMADPRDRRHRYPFINCTECGPRYTIIRGLPYDRERTTMRGFSMCGECRAEYDDPGCRRFHAEPIACARCGPQVALWDSQGTVQATGDEAIRKTAAALASGRIAAVKGLGGFHLMVDAGDEAAVRELRRRKHRDEKPLAVMVTGLAQAGALAVIGSAEAALLAGPAAPIVLLERRPSAIAPSVAPGSPCLGLLLPYTPLHHLLLAETGRALVATSGNVAEEPICTDEQEVRARLHDIADLYLVHDRPIARYVDDSVVRVVAGGPMLLRRARGYAPLPVADVGDRRVVVGAGAHVRSAVAITIDGQVVASPHVGDLDTLPAREGFQHTVDTLVSLYGCRPEAIACDRHPDYASTLWAERQGLPVTAVQHHYAHVLAGMADNGLEPPVTGIAWDGSGYGMDGSIWGGEALRVGTRGFERVGWLRPFPLPGGARAVKEPRWSAVGVLWDMQERGLVEWDEPLARLCTAEETVGASWMLTCGVNSPRTSSAGRLFDAVAALTGLHPGVQFEGQAAMALERALAGFETDEGYPFATGGARHRLVIDWAPTIAGVLHDVERRVPIGAIAARFHNALADMIVAAAQHAQERRVVLTGGCFQNKYLSERAITRLREEGFEPFWHHQIPPNDAGIAVGQVMAVARDGKGGE